MSGKALILGASGRFGRHAAEAFWNAGWQVREFNRATDDLMSATKAADVIVNGWNPAYPDWARDVPRMTADIIEAARVSGATVIIPGNVYGYGAGSGPVLREETPMEATNPLGLLRIEMEEAYRISGVRTILLRTGDFIDTEASGNWFDKVIVSKASKGWTTSPGDPSAEHAWAFLPDVALAAVLLAEKRAQLADFEDVVFPGYALSLANIADLVASATGTPQQVIRLNWLPLKLAAFVWPMGRKLLEMRYLWDMPHRLESGKFHDLLPQFAQTDPATAIERATAFSARAGKEAPDQVRSGASPVLSELT